MSRFRAMSLVLAASATVAGCVRDEPPAPPAPEKSRSGYVELGDLAHLRERGILRLLTIEQVPETGASDDSHFDARLLAQFAESEELELLWVHVNRASELVPALLKGQGDLIVSEAPLRPSDRKPIAETVPVAKIRARIAARRGESLVTPAGLADRWVAARRHQEGWRAIEELQSDHPGIRLEPITDSVTDREVLRMVADGRFDVALADDRTIAASIEAGHPLQRGLPIGPVRSLTWGLRPDALELATALNRFLNQNQVLEAHRELFTDDLDGIRAREVIRVITRNSPASYFVWRGQLRGFEYELTREMSRQLDLHVEMVVPPPEADLIDWLLAGKGDMIAASLAITEERKNRGVAFTDPYHQAIELLVMRHDDPLRSIADLDGRRVIVNPGTSYWRTAERLRESGINVAIEPPPVPLGTDEIISRVADGEFDLTIADSHIAALEMAWRDDVVADIALGDPVDHGWAVRSESPSLLAALNSFIDKEYRGLFYNVVYERYFSSNAGQPPLPLEARAEEGLCPWDGLVRTYSSTYGFDWRLVVALMFQESRFDPEARSPNGALGLMQMLPRTAGQLGFSALHDPETGIHAGVKYLAWLRDRFENDLSVHDRTWFALAAYNAGYGHVQDARRLATQLGLDRDRWFSNVERAMLLLSRPDYAQSARYGYCRGAEPVAYVRTIRDRFAAYSRTAES